jgi:hypothetical protein
MWLAVVLGMAGLAAGQDTPVAGELMRRAVQHKLDEAKTHKPVRYLIRKQDLRRDTTKEIVETKDGDVARLVAEDGKPLSSDADTAEMARLDDLAAHPELQQKRKRAEEKDASQVQHILRLMPEALVYTMTGTVACGQGTCWRLTFAPKAGWDAPDMESELLTGVVGEVWIDREQEELVRIDATFEKSVRYLGGILGRLDKGSTLRLEQSDVGRDGKHDWELTGLAMNVTGKALMVKSLEFKVTEEATNFREVPGGMGYRDGIRLLKSSASGR